ncbi:HAD hydrolase family protein, partial [Streptococcus suis]
TTGRPLQAIGTFLEELDLLWENQYSITFNGGLVHENTGRVLDKVGFNIEDVRTIRRVTNDLDLTFDFMYGGDVYYLP